MMRKRGARFKMKTKKGTLTYKQTKRTMGLLHREEAT
jgi:hypothetical protein